MFTDETIDLKTNEVVGSQTEDMKVTGITAAVEMHQVKADNIKKNSDFFT